MKLRQLECFVRAAERGSFTAAAADLNVSQPALGQQVQDLEAEFGQRLFERAARGVRLTDAGTRLLAHATDILSRVAETSLAMESLRGGQRRDVRLGYPPTPGRLIVPELLVRLQAAHEVRTHSQSGLSYDLLELVGEGKLDAALCYDTYTSHDLDAAPLVEETMFLVGLPGIVDREAGDIGFRELSRFPLVLDSRFRGARQRIEEIAGQQGVKLDVSFDVEAVDLRNELMRRHGRCTIVPLGTFCDAVDAGELVARRIVRPTISRTLSLVMRRGFDPALRAIMLDLTRQIVAERALEGRYFWHRLPGGEA